MRLFACVIILYLLLQVTNTSAQYVRNRSLLEPLAYKLVGNEILSSTVDEHGGEIEISFDGEYIAV